MLVVGMKTGFPHVIIFFGALKMGTRFDSARSCKASTNYFVLGNVISVLMVLVITHLSGPSLLKARLKNRHDIFKPTEHHFNTNGHQDKSHNSSHDIKS